MAGQIRGLGTAQLIAQLNKDGMLDYQVEQHLGEADEDEPNN
jgi:hypothetical protein